MLRAFGLYLTKSTKNALWVALLCGVLSVFAIPVAWIGLVIVGLVTLHDNHKSGFLVLAAFVLPELILGLTVDFSFFMEAAVFRGLIVWLLAWILSQTNSWTMVLRVGVIAALAAVSIFYLSVDDVAVWWERLFNLFLGSNNSISSLWESPEKMQAHFKQIANFATGLSALWFLILDLVMVLMARGWQALLYNPGGLSKELLAIRMSKVDSIVLFLCAVAFGLGLPIAGDFLPLCVLPFVIAGFSLVQVKIATKESKTSLRLAFYVLLLIFFSYIALMLMLVGIIDSWYDFRARWASPGATFK